MNKTFSFMKTVKAFVLAIVAITLTGITKAEASFVYYKLDGSANQTVIITAIRSSSNVNFWGPLVDRFNREFDKLREGSGTKPPGSTSTLTPQQVLELHKRLMDGLESLRVISENLRELNALILGTINPATKNALLREFKLNLDLLSATLSQVRILYFNNLATFTLDQRTKIAGFLNDYIAIENNARAFYAKHMIVFQANDSNAYDTYHYSTKSTSASRIYASGGGCYGGVCYQEP